jgi:hypothetical protein
MVGREEGKKGRKEIPYVFGTSKRQGVEHVEKGGRWTYK